MIYINYFLAFLVLTSAYGLFLVGDDDLFAIVGIPGMAILTLYVWHRVAKKYL
jgi:hypothetical protein